jgi:MFS family permease
MHRPPEREPSASRNIYVFGITSFLNDTATEMAYWVLPAFLASLGAGPAQLGLIEGVAESVASFAKLFSGYLTDRIDRRKPIVVAGYAVANAVKPLLAMVTAWWHILLIRFADRLAKGVRGAPRDVMVAESVPKDRLGSAYGLIQSMDSAGAIAGPLAALFLLSRFGIRSVFWAAAAPGALCVLVALLGIRETKRPLTDTGSDLEDKTPSEFLSSDCGRDAVFYRKFERYVSCAASAESRYCCCSRAFAGFGLQRYIHACLLASRMVQRPRFAASGWFRGLRHFRGGLFCFRTRAVNDGNLDCDGGLRILLRPHAACAEGFSGRERWSDNARPWTGNLFFCDQRGYVGSQFDYRRVVETVWSSGPILFLEWHGAGRGSFTAVRRGGGRDGLASGS